MGVCRPRWANLNHQLSSPHSDHTVRSLLLCLLLLSIIAFLIPVTCLPTSRLCPIKRPGSHPRGVSPRRRVAQRFIRRLQLGPRGPDSQSELLWLQLPLLANPCWFLSLRDTLDTPGS